MLALLLALPLLAHGDVLIVDRQGRTGFDYHFIWEAVAAAQDGDTVLVRGGTHEGFEVSGKSISVVAAAGAIVVLGRPFGVSEDRIVVRDVPAGGTVLLRGIATQQDVGAGLEVRDCEGTVWAQSCDFRGGWRPLSPAAPAILVEDVTDLVLIDCRGVGAWTPELATPRTTRSTPALHAVVARVLAYDTVLRGGAGRDATSSSAPASAGAAGAYVQGELFLAGGALTGGVGGDGATEGGLCLEAGRGGDGLQLALGRADLAGAAVQGGAAGLAAPGCPPSRAGRATFTAAGKIETIPAPPHRFSVDEVVREGEDATFRVEGAPGTEVWLAWATHPKVRFEPSDPTPGLLPPPGPHRLLALGVIPSSGVLVRQLAVGGLPSSVRSYDVYFQLGLRDGSGLALGAGRATTVLASRL